MKELFEKIYIRSEEDLPKVEDVYYVHIKPDNRVTEWAFHKDASHQELLKYIDWYLRPAAQEKVTDEDIHIEAQKKHYDSGLLAMGYEEGARDMRDGLITHNK